MADRMRAQDFDNDGYFCPDGEARYSLLGHPIAIPAMVTYSGKTEHEEILLSAQVPIGDCRRCGERTVGDTLIFATNQYRLLVLRCCDRVIWTTEEFLKEKREENGERTERDFE